MCTCSSEIAYLVTSHSFIFVPYICYKCRSGIMQIKKTSFDLYFTLLIIEKLSSTLDGF